LDDVDVLELDFSLLLTAELDFADSAGDSIVDVDVLGGSKTLCSRRTGSRPEDFFVVYLEVATHTVSDSVESPAADLDLGDCDAEILSSETGSMTSC